MKRRAFIATALAALARPAGAASTAAPAVAYAGIAPGFALAFPRDHGAHPDYRTEWWYVTGWVEDAAGAGFGVQVTFFRSRPGIGEDNPSAFAPRELVFAHAALADAGAGRLLHDDRAARAGFGLAGTLPDRTQAFIGDWSLVQDGGVYRARIAARGFAFDLAFAASGPPLPEGDAGYSRKGPLPQQASGYYSRPQLAVSGTLDVGARRVAVTGRAWLDHEWSSEYLAPGAVGWDWTGVNLDDGGALMAFRIRDAQGAALWAGATLMAADGAARAYGPAAVRFAPGRRWRSPRTGVDYPVAWTIGVGGREWTLAPVFDDQELDARRSTGTVYWEGAVRASEAGRPAGRGYLELTGYGRPLRL